MRSTGSEDGGGDAAGTARFIMFRYPAIYADAYGPEQTSISNDGETLTVPIRGVPFTGTDFDALRPPADATAEQLRTFSLHHGVLCACRIRCSIPVPIGGRMETVGELAIELSLGDPAPPRGLDREALRIALHYGGKAIAGSSSGGWFEDELLSIQSQLPEGVFIKACINCQYSDYGPAGHGMFGGMMCFRNIKAEYVKVRTKRDFWAVHDRFDRWVQETYLCAQFERRKPGTGYRG